MSRAKSAAGTQLEKWTPMGMLSEWWNGGMDMMGVSCRDRAMRHQQPPHAFVHLFFAKLRDFVKSVVWWSHLQDMQR